MSGSRISQGKPPLRFQGSRRKWKRQAVEVGKEVPEPYASSDPRHEAQSKVQSGFRDRAWRVRSENKPGTVQFCDILSPDLFLKTHSCVIMTSVLNVTSIGTCHTRWLPQSPARTARMVGDLSSHSDCAAASTSSSFNSSSQSS